MDFVLTAVEDLINSIASAASETLIAYILDSDSNLMIAASIANISTTPDGQADVFLCGVPEIQVSIFLRRDLVPTG